MAENLCPHCFKVLKLVATTEAISTKKTTTTKRYRCTIQGCGFTHTERMEQEGA